MILSERRQWGVIEWIILNWPLQIFIDKVSGNRDTMDIRIHAPAANGKSPGVRKVMNAPDV